jgi:AmmeMemoRadiSam system protein B
MLTFAAFLPHPPIIIPQIGGEDRKKCQSTINAFNCISKVAEKSEIETLVIISPHTSVHPNEMTISFNDFASGDLSAFDKAEVKIRKEIDVELSEEIYKTSKKYNVPTRLLEQEGAYFIDHASMIPLLFLENYLPSSFRIVIIGFSLLERQPHLDFGKAIYKAITKMGYNVGVIFSGDMSHKIFEEGAEFVGQKFDKEICSAINNNQITSILNIDEYLQDEAGECGYNSLLVALGMLQEHGLDKVTSKVLSYEAPFGVGYMVANFELKLPSNR